MNNDALLQGEQRRLKVAVTTTRSRLAAARLARVGGLWVFVAVNLFARQWTLQQSEE